MYVRKCPLCAYFFPGRRSERLSRRLVTHKLALELNSYLYPAKSRLTYTGPKFLHVAIRVVILLDTTVSMNCRGVKIVSSVSISVYDKLRIVLQAYKFSQIK